MKNLNKILLIDSENIPYGSIRINAGDRFAQMIFASYFVPDLNYLMMFLL